MTAVFWDKALCVLAAVQESPTQMAVPESSSEIVVQLYQVTWCICQKTVSSVNNDVRTSSLITLRHSSCMTRSYTTNLSPYIYSLMLQLLKFSMQYF